VESESFLQIKRIERRSKQCLRQVYEEFQWSSIQFYEQKVEIILSTLLSSLIFEVINMVEQNEEFEDIVDGIDGKKSFDLCRVDAGW
jgi:hypothetical protein